MRRGERRRRRLRLLRIHPSEAIDGAASGRHLELRLRIYKRRRRQPPPPPPCFVARRVARRAVRQTEAAARMSAEEARAAARGRAPRTSISSSGVIGVSGAFARRPPPFCCRRRRADEASRSAANDDGVRICGGGDESGAAATARARWSRRSRRLSAGAAVRRKERPCAPMDGARSSGRADVQSRSRRRRRRQHARARVAAVVGARRRRRRHDDRRRAVEGRYYAVGGLSAIPLPTTVMKTAADRSAAPRRARRDVGGERVAARWRLRDEHLRRLARDLTPPAEFLRSYAGRPRGSEVSEGVSAAEDDAAAG